MRRRLSAALKQDLDFAGERGWRSSGSRNATEKWWPETLRGLFRVSGLTRPGWRDVARELVETISMASRVS